MAVRHFYVDSNNGTNTGTTDTSYASRQIGAMSSLTASNVYDRLGRVFGITTKPTDEDFIYVADNHSPAAYNNGASPIINGTGVAGGVGLQIISVDTTAIDEYKPGSSYEELNDGSDDFALYKNTLIAGVNLKTSDDVLNGFALDGYAHIMDTILYLSTGAADMGLRHQSAGRLTVFTNVEINAGLAGNNAFAIAEGKFHWNGGKLSGVAMTSQLTGGIATAGTAVIEIKGVDLSTFTGQLMPDLGTGAEDGFMRLVDCQLNASVTPYGTLTQPQHRFEMFGCDDSTGGIHRFLIADGTGSAVNNDTVYVTATESWYEGTDKSSIQVDTTAICSHAMSFIFELPAQYVNLAEGTTDTLTIDIATAETLVKHDMAAFLVYPDGTTAVTPVWVSSGPSVGSGNYGIDPLDTSTTMPASALGSGDWTGSPGANRYELVLDTSGTPGQAAAVSVRIEVYKASIGPIYIHPLITVSAT